MHLFLDTKTYLGFFRLSDDNLDQLKKLSERVGSRETTLYVTEQVRAEFLRNRESTIDEALDTVRKAPRLPSVSMRRTSTDVIGSSSFGGRTRPRTRASGVGSVKVPAA